MFDLGAEVPADDRHQCLEKPEVKGKAEVMAKGERLQAGAYGDRNRKGIHSQSDGDGENGQETQAGPAIAKMLKDRSNMPLIEAIASRKSTKKEPL